MKIVWNPSLNTPPVGASVSLTKPAALFADWAPKADDVCEAPSAMTNQLARVHDLDYVRGVLSQQITNGFGNSDPRWLRHILAANGVMITAVRLALLERSIVCAPVSGFHHAGYAAGGGYCTFNGLLAAVQNARVLRAGPLRNVLIIDGDGHYGDGTDDILNTLRIAGVCNHSARYEDSMGRLWHARLKAALMGHQWDLILYQAGADAHSSDPYGVGYLDDDGWRERDELVFGHVVREGIPCVWNLAGGYGERTLALHTETYRTARAHERSLRFTQMSEAAAAEPDVVEHFGIGGSTAQDVVEHPRLAEGS